MDQSELDAVAVALASQRMVAQTSDPDVRNAGEAYAAAKRQVPARPSALPSARRRLLRYRPPRRQKSRLVSGEQADPY